MPNYRLGRLPGQVPVGLRGLPYYAAGSLPKAPASVAVPVLPTQPDGTPWGMDMNDTLGDCGVAGVNHGFMAAALCTGRQDAAIPTDQQVGDYYMQYTGGQDSGVVLSQFLAYVRANGFLGHTVSAYAPVAVHDVPTLTFAIDAYDFAYVGITVYEGMMAAAQASGPWTWTPEDLSGGEVGGHCIILAGYDANWLYGITWGNIVRIAYPAWHQMSDEAWAIITGEVDSAKADGHGINLAALVADLSRLDGAAQQPAAAAPGHASLLDELAGAVRNVAASSKKDVTELLAFLASHGL